MKVVYVVPRLQHGGATRSTIDLAHALRDAFDIQGTVISLGTAHADVVAQAQAAGLSAILGSGEAMSSALREAELVHVAFWNTPEMYAWFRSHLPPMRLLIMLQITGQFPAQMVTTPLLDFADWLIPTTNRSLTLSVFQPTLQARAERVKVLVNSLRLADAVVRNTNPRAPRVGYIGTVDFVKMHPRFIEWCAAVNVPNVTFPIAGSGDGFRTLVKQAEQYGIAQRMQWLGYQQNVGALLGTLDVFGYPLCPDTYATTDLILQEAMWHGVPPVILPYGGTGDLVRHNETGLIVSEQDYPDAVTGLVMNETERTRLGENARAFAHAHFNLSETARDLFGVYQDALRFPKSERVWQGERFDAAFPGGSALIESFGTAADAYRTSLTSTDAERVCAADRQISLASPIETNGGAGGILDYRRAYRNDAILRLWAGLVLAQQKRFALAGAEFYAAQQLGLRQPRVATYLERVMAHQMLFQAEDA